MSGTHEQKHPYHLVDPSPWPAVGAMSAFVLAIGMILWMHDHTILVMLVGVAAVMGTMFFWFRDVVRESQSGLYHTPVVNLGIRYGMVLFIASEVMFFAAFFWAYFAAALYPTEAIGGVWPPAGTVTFDPFTLPFLNTLILLLSGCTVTWAHHALREGNRRDLIRGLQLTVALGVLFTVVQGYEYSHAAFGFSDDVYTSTFYMATGFHGFHVIVGTIMLAVCLIRAQRGHFTNEEHFGFEAAAWYWHFVDVVWLFLFVAVYWWGA